MRRVRRAFKGFSLCSTYKPIRLPCRLRNACSVADGKSQPHRRFQRNAVPCRNVHGGTVCPGSKGGAYRFVPVANGAPFTLLPADHAMPANEQAFRATYRWQVQDDSQVRSKPHPAWMCISLAVAKQQIRRVTQFSERRQQRGNFAETQKTWNIRKRERHFGGDTLEFQHLRIAE